MAKLIEVVEEGKRILINVDKISRVYQGVDHNAIIVINEREKDFVILTSTNYNEVKDKIRNHYSKD